MEPIVAAAESAGEGWPLVVASAMSVAVFCASMLALVLTAGGRPLAHVMVARVCRCFLAGLLVVASIPGLVAPWAVALSCLGFLLALQAIALSFGRRQRLLAYLTLPAMGDEPGWWPEFERGFRRYSSARAVREPNRSRRAVRRPPTGGLGGPDEAGWEGGA